MVKREEKNNLFYKRNELPNSVVHVDDDVLVLGELLKRGREAKGWSRYDLSIASGVSQNSIVRYEACGIDENGQTPPAHKLAKLAMELGLDPITLLISTLPKRDQYQAGLAFKVNFNNPMHEYYKDQCMVLLHENHIFRTFLKEFFGASKTKSENHDKSLLEKLSMVQKIYDAQELFEETMINSGQFKPIMRDISEPYSVQEINYDLAYKGAENLHLASAEEIASKLDIDIQNFDNVDTDKRADVSKHFKGYSIFSTFTYKGEKEENSEADLAIPPSSQDD